MKHSSVELIALQGMWKRRMTVTTKSKRGQQLQIHWKTTSNKTRRFKTMEAAALRLQKESKGYLDSLRGTLMIYDT
jgi:hypothetical protein